MQTAEQLSITLPVEMAQAVHDKVRAGLYSSDSEIIREALDIWLEREQQWQELDAAIAEGIEDIEAGRVRDLEEVRSELKARFKAKIQ